MYAASKLTPEAQLLLAEIESFRARFRGESPFDAAAMEDAARDLTKGLTDDDTYATELIVKGGWSIRDAASMLISEHASAELLTGKHHLYRGVLSDRGKGYLTLFKVTTARMMASGRLSEMDAVDGVKEFENEIAQLG